MGTILLSAVLAHSGWHWMSDRLGELTAYRFAWPAMTYAFFASLVRWAMLLVVVGAVLWGMAQVYGRFLKSGKVGALSQTTDSS